MHSRRDFLARAPLGALALSAAATGFRRPAFAAATDASITMGVSNDVVNWDPVTAGSPVTVPIQKSVFDMPLEVSPNLGIKPGVVSAYKWLDTEGKTLELTLRGDVTFHNGDPLTSEDIKFTFFDRPKADNTLMIAGVWGSIVQGVETPSPTKVIFHFTDTYIEAVPLLGSIPAYIMPKKYYKSVGHDGYMAKPIGSGPYKLVDWQRGSRIVLEAYDKYWRGPAAIKHLTFQIMPDPSARIAAIQAGQVDFISNIPVREANRLGTLPGLVADVHPITAFYLIHMVNKGIYKDQNLRLAMHHAIDKAALSKAFFDGKVPAQMMFEAKGTPGNDPSFDFPYSPAKAKELLAKSGFGPDKPVQIVIYTLSGTNPADYDLARAVVQMWKQVGIEADLRILTAAQYFDMTRNNKLDAPAFYAWTNGTGDPILVTGLILDPKKRYSVWKSDDITPKLEPILHETDYDKRIAGFKAFDAWAVEQGYEVPIIQTAVTAVHTKRLNYLPFANGWTLPYYWSPVS